VQAGIDLGPAVQQQQAGLGRDDETHLVAHFEAGATDKGLLVQETLDQALQLLALRCRHAAVLDHVAFDDRQLAGVQRPCQGLPEAPARQSPGQEQPARDHRACECGAGVHQEAS
jgi:hypothetical protein